MGNKYHRLHIVVTPRNREEPFFLMTFVIPGFEIYIRKEIVEYTGSIVVFIIMGVIKISKFLIESWLRKNTISSLIVQQKSAISYAQRTLNEDGFNI